MKTRLLVLLIAGLLLAPDTVSAQAPNQTTSFNSTTTANASPTAYPDGVKLLHYEILDLPDSDILYVLGEYKNVGKQTAVAPVLVLVLKDKDGTIVETNHLLPANGHLKPGQTGGFTGNVLLKRGEWASEEIIFCKTSLLAQSDNAPDLEVKDVVEVEKSSDKLELKGKVFNHGSNPAQGVLVKAIITRSKDHRFAGSAIAGLDVPLPGNTAAVFTLTVYDFQMPGIKPGDDYTYTVDAEYDSSVGIACG